MQLRFGTNVEVVDGRISRIVDRVGGVHAELHWTGDQLDRLVVPGAIVRGAIIDDALLGKAHAIDPTGTTMSALDWRQPAEIPTVAAPAKLPGGAGSAILNTIAHLARWADIPALRYAGPYPTHALFETLRRSFHTTSMVDAFTANVMDRAMRVARDPIPIDFIPDPCERIAMPGGFVELRTKLERVTYHGVGYERGGGVARLVDDLESTVSAEIWFGDELYARVAVFTDDGTIVRGPDPVPACRSEVIGREFPPALRAALAEIVGEIVLAPLAADARRLVNERPIAWADLRARAASRVDGGFAVHAALWDRLAPRGMARVALALAEALAPVVSLAIVDELH